LTRLSDKLEEIFEIVQKLEEEKDYLERHISFQDYLFENIGKALDGKEVSDFALSFPIVRRVADLVYAKELDELL